MALDQSFDQVSPLMDDAIQQINRMSSSPATRAALLTRAQLFLTTAICQQTLESMAANEDLLEEHLSDIGRILQQALLDAEEQRHRMEMLYLVGGQKQ